MVINQISFMGLGSVACTIFPFLNKVLPKEQIRVIAGGKRKVRLETQGIYINEKHYDLLVTSPEEVVKPADLLIVAVKYDALPQAIQDMKRHIGENTIILSIMNGIDSREKIGEVYSIEKCIYGLCNLSTINQGNGHFKISLSPAGIKFGEAVNKTPYTERIHAIVELFEAAGVPYVVPEDMVHEQWWKFMLNVSGNSTNTLLRGTQSYFQKIDAANAARRMMMEEVLAISKAMGTGLTEEDVEAVLTAYHQYPGENKCSMLQDFESGRKTENAMLCGIVVELGKKYGIPTPVNQYVYYMIEALDQVNEGILNG